jgi:uncharacterized Zn ribbon protein
MEARNSNENLLSEADFVTLIIDLKVKRASLNLKRGTLVRKISLTRIRVKKFFLVVLAPFNR